MSFLKTFFKMMACSHFRLQPRLQNYGLLLLQIATRFSKWGKHFAKKDGCSSHWVMFTRARITLYPCFIDLMYVSVHHFLYKKRSLLYIANTFPSMILLGSICTKLGGTMIFEIQSDLKFFIKFATQLMTNKFKFFVKILN